MGEVNTSLFLSLVTAFGVCAASVLVWFPEVRVRDAELKIGILAIAPAWAVISAHPHFHTTLVFARKSVTGSVIGAMFGASFSHFNEPKLSGLRYGGLALSFPVILFFCLCDTAVATPLQGMIFTPAALLTFYCVFAFGPSEPSNATRMSIEIILAFALAGICTVLIHLALSLFFRRRSSMAAWDVKMLLHCILADLVHATGGIITYLEAGFMFKAKMTEQLKNLQCNILAFNAAIAAWKLESCSPNAEATSLRELQTALNSLASTQLTMLLSTYRHAYSLECRGALWNPTDSEQKELRFKIVAALQHVADSEIGNAERIDAEEAIGAACQAKAIFHEAVQSTIATSATKNLSEGYSSSEAMRSLFAQLALCRLPSQLDRLFLALCNVNMSIAASISIGNCLCIVSAVSRQDVAQLLDATAYFPEAPGSASGVWTRLRRNLRHPFRMAFVNHLGAFVLMLLKDLKTPAADYVMWALLPCIVCLLPTPGAVILKGGRRVVGTVVGALLAFGSLAANASNTPALLTQLFLVSLSAKWFSFGGPLKGYAGLIVALTWCIVVLGKKDLDGEHQILRLASWRVGMTISGVIYVVIASAVVLPSYATGQLERGLGAAFESALMSCVATLQDSMPKRAGSKASPGNITLREAVAKLRPMLEEADAEIILAERRVNKLGELLDQTDAVAGAIEMCGAVAKELRVMKTDHALRWCLNCGDGLGQQLAESLEECFDWLLKLASSLNSFLHGYGQTFKDLTCSELRTRLQTNFSAVRACSPSAFKNGEIPELMGDGIMNVWAFIFALDNLLQECDNMAAIVFGAVDKPHEGGSDVEAGNQLLPPTISAI